MIRFNSNTGGSGKLDPSDVVPAGPYVMRVSKTKVAPNKSSGYLQLMLEMQVKVGDEKKRVTVWISFHRPVEGTDIAIGRDQIKSLTDTVSVSTEGEWDERVLQGKVAGVWLDYEGPRKVYGKSYGPRNVLPVGAPFFPVVMENGIARLPDVLPESPLDPDTGASDEDPGYDGPPADYDEDDSIPF